MLRFLIDGGHPLKGEIQLKGSTAAAVAGLAAGLLAGELFVLEKVPRNRETLGMLELLEFLGLRPMADFTKETVSLESAEVKLKALTPSLCQKTKAYPLLLGALLSRFNEAVIPSPSVLGFHQIDRILSVLAALGIEIKEKNGFIFAKGKVKSGNVSFRKNTILGTMTIILTTVLGNSEIRLDNASEEPEVDFLIETLNGVGAQIKREGARTILIRGVESLTGALVKIPADRDLAVFWAIIALVSHGDILIKGIEKADLTAFLSKITAQGGLFQATDDGLRFWSEENEKLKALEIETRPHPGFMSNWGPIYSLLLSQSDGVSVLHETVYPNRFSYLPFLGLLGAEYQIFEPDGLDHAQFYSFDLEDDDESYKHAVKIFGPTSLKPTSFLKEAEDFESNLAILAAGLTAQGQSEIVADKLLAGYEELAQDLKKVGAKIEVV